MTLCPKAPFQHKHYQTYPGGHGQPFGAVDPPRTQKTPLLWAFFILLVAFQKPVFAQPEIWTVTAYCSDFSCTQKYPSDPTYGITASGNKVRLGTAAVNWLPFGTKLKIDGLGTYTVQDRGAKSLFGSKANPIRHVDLWMESHQKAKEFGNKRLEVVVLNGV